MLKAISDYSDNEKLLMVLQGCDYATYEANDDIKKFNRYQNNQIDGFSERTLQDMEILVMLKDLGFPMHELGTYLYKDLISEICEVLKNLSDKRDDINVCRELLGKLNDAYSSFYHAIGREWKELGISSFHLYIIDALESIDYDSVNQELSSKINGNDFYDISYGTQAFMLAAYALKKYSFSDAEYKKPLLKKLNNGPKPREYW